MKLSSANVEATFLDCLFSEDEAAHISTDPEDKQFIPARGIVTNVGFHPNRLKGHEADIRSMLAELPAVFQSPLVGETFLNMCVDIKGEQWTGQHRVMDQLVCLGKALDLVSLLPEDRDMYKALPGGVPFVIVKLEK